MLFYVILYYIILLYMIYYIKWYYTILYYTILYYVMLCYVILYYILFCYLYYSSKSITMVPIQWYNHFLYISIWISMLWKIFCLYLSFLLQSPAFLLSCYHPGTDRRRGGRRAERVSSMLDASSTLSLYLSTYLHLKGYSYRQSLGVKTEPESQHTPSLTISHSVQSQAGVGSRCAGKCEAVNLK